MIAPGRTLALPCVVMACVLDASLIPGRIQKYKFVHAELVKASREASTSSARTVLMARARIRMSRGYGCVRADGRLAQPAQQVPR